MFVYLPSEDELPDNIENQESLRWFKIAKAKEGKLGKFKMYFDGKYQRFTEGWDYFVDVECDFDKVVQMEFTR